MKLAEAAEADTFAADVESSVQDLLNGKGYFESKLNEFYNNESFESINADKLDMLSVLDQRRQHEDSQLQVKIQELQKANDELDSMKRMLTILKSGKSDNRPDNKIEEIIVEDVEEEEVSEQYEFNDMLKTLLDAKSQISSSNDELRRETISTIESLAEKERVINQLRDKLTHLENLQNQFQSNKQVTFAEDTERILEENQLKQTDLDRKHEILRMLSGDDQEEEDLTEQYEDVVDEEEEGEVEELMTRLDNASVQEIAATSQTNETAAQEQDDIDNDSSVESQMKYLYDTREKINESINVF